MVQSLSHVRLFSTPCSAAHQFPSPSPSPESLLKLMSIESVIPSNHLLLCRPLLLLSSVSQHQGLFLWVSSPQVAKVLELQLQPSVLPMNVQGWFPLEVTGLISLQSKGLSRVFSNITVWKHQFFGAQPSLWSSSHIHTISAAVRKEWKKSWRNESFQKSIMRSWVISLWLSWAGNILLKPRKIFDNLLLFQMPVHGKET